jgi:hypothetical protein
VEKNDTTVTDYSKGKSFIKIINKTHFAFIGHDLNKGKDSTVFFSSGGGTYLLNDSLTLSILSIAMRGSGKEMTFILRYTSATIHLCNKALKR